jgi:3'(2'), 5'-bisphosphate nucleotidase
LKKALIQKAQERKANQMSNMNRPEARIAVDLIKQCCDLAVIVQSDTVGSFIEKDDRSPVTLADFSVQALVSHRLGEAFQGIPLMAEESTSQLEGAEGEQFLERVAGYVRNFEPLATAESVRSWIDRSQWHGSSRFWVLDPIDGTKGFLRGAQYVVALALIVDGAVEIAVLGCPRLSLKPAAGSSSLSTDPAEIGSLLIAVRGEGAWLTSLEDEDFVRLRVSECEDPRSSVALRSFESGHTDESWFERTAEHMGIETDPILLDSQAKYAVLAGGYAGLHFRLISPLTPDYREKIWDVAAGALIVQEAGGRVTDLTGRELDYGAGYRLENNQGILASNGKLHELALKSLQATKQN